MKPYDVRTDSDELLSSFAHLQPHDLSVIELCAGAAVEIRNDFMLSPRLGIFKYSPKCFVVRSALRCFRELPSGLLKF